MARTRRDRDDTVRTYDRDRDTTTRSSGWGIATLVVLVIAAVLVVGWAADWWEPNETNEGVWEEETGFQTVANPTGGENVDNRTLNDTEQAQRDDGLY